ncbi:MAG: N-acetylmuramoyl-L-alanine amidase [Sarcina sp.]
MIDVILDASHGGNDLGNIGILGTKEKECTLYIAKICRNILESKGLNVRLTRESDELIESEVRSKIANENQAKCFVSIHLNGSDDRRENGIEVVTSRVMDKEKDLSVNILKSLSGTTKLNSRGIKQTDSIMFNEIKIPAAKVKVCFITNPREEKLLLDRDFNQEIAGFLAEGIMNYLKVDESNDNIFKVKTEESTNMDNLNFGNDEGESINKMEATTNLETLTNILGGEIPDRNQAKQWAKNKNMDESIIDLVDLYWNLANERGNVNPAIAYSQAIIEMNRGELLNENSSSYFNPAGIKEDKNEKCKKFKSWREGVEAHLDHLALYAGAKGYPNKESNDPRHFSYLFGVCKYVENLSGKWNSDAEYGINILKSYYEILETQTKDVFRESIESIDGLKTQIGEFKSKVVLMGRTLEEVCKEYNQIYKSLEVLKEEIVGLEVDKQSLEKRNVELNENVSKQKQVLRDIVKMIGGTVEKK